MIKYMRYLTFVVLAVALPLAGVAAEGFVRVEKTGSGWTFVDGAGAPFVSRGVGWVSVNGPRNVRTKISAYRETCRGKYPQAGDWEKATVARMRDWGFNTFGSDSSPTLRGRGLRHTILVRMGAAPATWKRDPDDYICPHAGHPCSAFPNVFSPKFGAFCDEVAARMCRPNRDDRDLTGYFIDNELAWWGASTNKVRDGVGLVDAVLALPGGHSAKKALERFVAARGERSEDVSLRTKEAFLSEIAERYFAETCAAIRRADPNHLVLGCRFAGLFGAHPLVWKAAGRHVDVVTVNVYPTVDFWSGRFSSRKGKGWVDTFATLEALQRLANRPVMVTEWSFPAKDTGHPCRRGAGQRLRNQDERARAASLFVQALEGRPYVVGWDFFMWTDMPKPQKDDADYPGEDCNYGLLDERDEPYGKLVEEFRRVNKAWGWTVSVEGRPLHLERVDVSVKEHSEPPANLRKKGEWLQFGTFAFDHPVEVRIACDRSLEKLEVLPAKYGIRPTRISDREVAFVVSKPCHLSFLPEGRVGALHLFAAKRDGNLPDPKGPGVRYFGPGVHRLGKDLRIGSGETLFVDEGAVLFAHPTVTGTNVTVCGNGIVSGGAWQRHKGPGPYSFAILDATNVTVRGVTVMSPYSWTVGVRKCRNVTFDEVKVIGCNMINDDGIDLVNSSDVTIRNSFVRTQDDNICTKGMDWQDGGPMAPVENVLVESCELWTDQANNFRFGYECDAAYMRNIAIRDVDILRYSPIPKPFTDRWCHAVIKAQSAEGMEFSGLDVRDLRVNSDGGDVCLVYLEPRPTGNSRRGIGHIDYTRGGTIRDCRFSDVDVSGARDGFTGWIYLKGRNAAENVRDVTFDAVRYFGEPVMASSPCVKIGGHVEGVRFLNGEFEVRAPKQTPNGDRGQRQFTNATELIQTAIDGAFRSGGGRVRVKRGYYPVRGLRLRSDVTLYLESGAVLQGSRLPGDYDILRTDVVEPVDFKQEARKVTWRPPDWAPSRKLGSTLFLNDACNKWNNAMIRILNARNVAIVGEEGAVIDGANSFDPSGEEGYRGVHGISAFDSTNVVFRGFRLQNTGNWAIRMQRCADVVGERLVLLAGHDGFHIRGGDRVTISDCRIDTGDDGVAGYDNHDLTVRRCDISSACSAFRIGGRDILVEDCHLHGPCTYVFRGSLSPQAKRDGVWDPEITDGRRTMATAFLYFCDLTMPLRWKPGNIVFRNCRVENAARLIRYNFGGETWQHGAPLADVTFENCRASGLTLPLALNATASEGMDVPLEFTMRNCSLTFARPQTEVISALNVKRIRLDGLKVTGAYAPLVRHWGAPPELAIERSGGLSAEMVPGTTRYSCPMR